MEGIIFSGGIVIFLFILSGEKDPESGNLPEGVYD
jgi:hypothetical protein